MTGPKALIIIILGLGVGHWSVLQVKSYLPQAKLWAAHKLLDEDLATMKSDNVDTDKTLLLCLKQLEDWQDRAMAARELLGQEAIASVDLIYQKKP